MAQINLPSITGTRTDTTVLTNDRMIIWPNSVSATSDLRYITFDNVKTYIVNAASTTYVSQTVIDAKGDMLVGTADNALARFGVGTNSHVLIADNTVNGGAVGMKWGQVETTGIADYAVTYNKLKMLQVGTLTGTTPAIDFTGSGLLNHSIGSGAGTVTYTGANYAAGTSITVRVTNDASNCNLNFPSQWKFVGYKPTVILANKTAILSITSFTNAADGCVAAWAVQT